LQRCSKQALEMLVHVFAYFIRDEAEYMLSHRSFRCFHVAVADTLSVNSVLA